MSADEVPPGLPWPWEDLPDHYRLALEEAREEIRDQRQRVDQIRNRATTLLAAASAILAFLGGRILDGYARHRLGDGWCIINGWTAVVCGIGAFLVVVAVVPFTWRRIVGRFTVSADSLVHQCIEVPQVPTLAESIRDLALWTEHNAAEIETKLNRRQRAVAVASGAVASEVVLLVVATWEASR